MSFLDRDRRRATMLGGPLDGDTSPVPLPDTMAWPQWTCHLVAGRWQHYEFDPESAALGAATYVYAGECDVDNHGGRPLPHEHACCCGRAGCDGREIR